jgi:hypothetical protein
MDVKLRDVDAQTVITLRAYPTQEQLVPWIQNDAMGLWEKVGPLGGNTGDAFLIYHGEVRPDLASTVEYCIPVSPDQQIPLELGPRIEPAHKQAYVRIPLRMMQFPEILQAYEAVENWVKENGKEITAPPREINFVNPQAIGPDDDAMDIAFPIAG